MSHFAVVVIGDDIDKQLAPYHEFECTGMDDEFVQDIDCTEHYRERYSKGVAKCLVKGAEILKEFECMTKGYFCSPLTKEQAQQVTSLGPFPAQSDLPPGVVYVNDQYVQFCPEAFGYERASIPVAQLNTFLEYLIEYEGLDPLQILEPGQPTNNKCKYKYVRLDEKGDVVAVIKRTNPNAKWDGYAIGGRWSGFFSTGRDNVDSCKWGDVDWVRAREERRQSAANSFDAWRAIYESHGKAKSLEEVAQEKYGKPASELERDEWNKALSSWSEQAAIVHAATLTLRDPVVEFGYDRDVYIERRVHKTLVPVAIVKEGKWYEKGEMGWFGVIHDEMSDDDWNKQVHDLYSNLDGDTQVTIVDCHI